MELSIAVKELIPIIIAGAIWGKEWAKQKGKFSCDESVVAICDEIEDKQKPSFNASFALLLLY